MKKEAYHQIWKLLNTGLTSKVFSILYSQQRTITEIARLLYDIPKDKRPYRNRIIGAVRKLQEYSLVRKKDPRLVKGKTYYEALINQDAVKALLEVENKTAEELSYIFNSYSFRQICGWKEEGDYSELIREVNDMPITGALLTLTSLYFIRTDILKISEKNIKIKTHLKDDLLLLEKNTILTTRKGKQKLKNTLKRYRLLKRKSRRLSVNETIQKIDEEIEDYQENVTIMFAILSKEVRKDLEDIGKTYNLLRGQHLPAKRFIRYIYR